MKNKNYSIIGILLTFLVSIGFIWSIYQIFSNEFLFERSLKNIRKRNEIRTYKNLNKIIKAQEKFIKKDWNKDGNFTYSDFLVHLWKTFDQSGEPVKVNLIPRKLAFAMGTTRAIDGYYFIDIRLKEKEKREKLKINYQKEWAIAAFPADQNSGELTFLISENKVIYAKEKTGLIDHFPSNPILSGWKRIDKISQIGSIISSK